MTAVFNRAADRLLRMVLPNTAASACHGGIPEGYCSAWPVRVQCYGGSNCTEWYQCVAPGPYVYCFVDQPGNYSSTYPGCC